MSWLVILVFLSFGTIAIAQNEENIKEGIALGGSDPAIKTISDEMLKEAEKLYQQIQTEVMPQVEKYKNIMSIDNTTGAIVFTAPPRNELTMDKKNEVSSGLNSTERIYIFISSSMPKALLENYSKSIDAFGLGGNAVFVLRGCVPSGGLAGCGDFKKTLEFVKSFVMNENDKGRQNSLWIDPILFQKYNIQEVPVFVYGKDVSPMDSLGSEGDYLRLTGSPSTWSSMGDWDLEYHLRQLYEQSKSKTLKRVIER